MSIKVLEYQQAYPKLNLKFKKKYEYEYELALLTISARCIIEGFVVKKISKTTFAGTKVTYKAIKSKEDLERYVNDWEIFKNKFIEKWGLTNE